MQERAVSVLIFPLLLGSLLAYGLYKQSAEELAVVFGFNVFFLMLLLSLLYLFFWFRMGIFTPIIGSMLGWGDVLFWLTVAIVFSPANFIIFFLSSLLFSLVLHLVILPHVQRYQSSKVPLAGLQALYLLAVFPLQWFLPQLDFYNDYLVLTCLS